MNEIYFVLDKINNKNYLESNISDNKKIKEIVSISFQLYLINELYNDNLTSTIEKIVLEEFDNSLIDNKNKEIKLIEKKISSLLDLGLESKIENTILESKMNELTKDKCKLENELNKLIEQRDSKENYNNRINDIKNKINTLNRLECFDRQVFEYMISKIIIGKSDNNEKQYPLHITFVLKNDDEISGYTNSTNKKRSLNNARLDITRDTLRKYHNS